MIFGRRTRGWATTVVGAGLTVAILAGDFLLAKASEIAAPLGEEAVALIAKTYATLCEGQVRELQELLRFRPTRDRYRVVVVDEVHMLSKSAFNALLKSIEEPPPYVLWIFATTERHKVPATILSRCQQLEFRPLSNEAIRSPLEAIADRS